MKLCRDYAAEGMRPKGSKEVNFYIAHFKLFTVKVAQDDAGCSWVVLTQAARPVTMGKETYTTPELAYAGALDYIMRVLLVGAKAEIDAEQKEVTK